MFKSVSILFFEFSDVKVDVSSLLGFEPNVYVLEFLVSGGYF